MNVDSGSTTPKRTPTPSTPNDRETTPSISPVARRRKHENPSKFYIIVFGVLSLISLVVAMISIKSTKFCVDQSAIFCDGCPENSKCQKTSFECNEGFLKSIDQCLKTSLSEEKIKSLHGTVIELIKAGEGKLATIKEKLGESDENADAAIKYNGDFMIHNTYVIKKPPRLDPRFCWSVFLLLIVLFFASIEKYLYKKYL